mgnify:CR=1 FL=1
MELIRYSIFHNAFFLVLNKFEKKTFWPINAAETGQNRLIQSVFDRFFDYFFWWLWKSFDQPTILVLGNLYREENFFAAFFKNSIFNWRHHDDGDNYYSENTETKKRGHILLWGKKIHTQLLSQSVVLKFSFSLELKLIQIDPSIHPSGQSFINNVVSFFIFHFFLVSIWK